jgi:hypothetical protein
MPFTLSHAAAALPFRRWRLVTSALVIGTFAPDFEYFLRLKAEDRFGHTPLGTLVLTFPVALAVLWIFHRFVKRAAARLLPEAVQRRVRAHLVQFRFGGVRRFLLIVVSLLLGIATHLLWDSFTHPNTWLYERWSYLREPVRIPVLGIVPCYKVLQHGSTAAGMAVLAIGLVYWYRDSEVSSQDLQGSLPATRKWIIVSILAGIALAGGALRALLGAQNGHFVLKNFVGEGVVTVIALLWWELVAYGILLGRGQSD